MTDQPTQPNTDDEPECLICADGPEECGNCYGEGEDHGGYDCHTCGGSGYAVPDHCCGCGGSPYCVQCSKCKRCGGDCVCPLEVTRADGTTRVIP